MDINNELKRQVLTITEVKKRLSEIEQLSKMDPEAAHSREDDLYSLALRAVIHHDPDCIEIANLALTAEKIEFPRWCA